MADNTELSDATIKVCVGNYGYYNEGELRDEWIELPKTFEQIQAFLEENGLYDAQHEETYISDYDGYPLEGCDDLFTELTRLEDLNLMAAQLATMESWEIEAAEKYISNQGSSMSMHEAMNVLLQADEVGYYDYGWGEYRGSDLVYQAIHDSASPETRFGHMLVNNNPQLKAFLESNPMIEAAFDVEEYGRQVELASDVVLYEDGYLDQGADIDLNYYSEREVVEEIIERTIEDPLLSDFAESLHGELQKRAIKEVARDLWGGKGYYNPEKSCIIASFVTDRPYETAYRFGIYEGSFISPERALKMAEADIDLADFCRDNHLLTRLDDAAWDSLSPELAQEVSGWYYSSPDVLKTVLGNREAAPAPPSPTRYPMPTHQDAPTPVADVKSDARNAAQSAGAQVMAQPSQVVQRQAGKSL